MLFEEHRVTQDPLGVRATVVARLITRLNDDVAVPLPAGDNDGVVARLITRLNDDGGPLTPSPFSPRC